MAFDDLAREELEDRLEMYQRKGWDANARAVEEVLNHRQDPTSTQERPTQGTEAEELAEELYQMTQIASSHGDHGNTERRDEIFRTVEEISKDLPPEVNEKYKEKVNSQW